MSAAIMTVETINVVTRNNKNYSRINTTTEIILTVVLITVEQ